MKKLFKQVIEGIAPTLLYRYQIWRSAVEPEMALLPQLCRKNAVSIDIGANKGLYVQAMLAHSAGVIAFEPLPLMLKRLHLLFGRRVTVHAVALSDYNGQCDIKLPAGNCALATIEPNNPLHIEGNVAIETQTVKVTTLDAYQLQHIGMIKIDVEGHEEKVLKGAIATITREQPNLIVEIEERHNPGAVMRVVTLLKNLGYNGYFFDKEKIQRVENFDLERDQNPLHVSVKGKTGHYINNFIFTPYAFNEILNQV